MYIMHPIREETTLMTVRLTPLKKLLICFTALLMTVGIATAQPVIAPDFSLKDTDGQVHQLSDHKGKVVVIEFFNPDCPFIKRAHTNSTFKETIKWSQSQGVVWLAVNANAAGKQGAALETNIAAKQALNVNFPILMNPTGTVGKAYGATRTPEMVIINPKGELVYQGGVDSSGGSSRPKNAVQNWLKTALEQVLAQKPVTPARTKPWGCSVKY